MDRRSLESELRAAREAAAGAATREEAGEMRAALRQAAKDYQAVVRELAGVREEAERRGRRCGEVEEENDRLMGEIEALGRTLEVLVGRGAGAGAGAGAWGRLPSIQKRPGSGRGGESADGSRPGSAMLAGPGPRAGNAVGPPGPPGQTGQAWQSPSRRILRSRAASEAMMGDEGPPLRSGSGRGGAEGGGVAENGGGSYGASPAPSGKWGGGAGPAGAARKRAWERDRVIPPTGVR